MRTAASILLTLVVSASALAADDYARPEMLAEAADIAAPEASAWVLLDCRERKAYEAGHIPQARWVNVEDWAKVFGDGADGELWSRKIAELGIDADSRVVAYDSSNFKDAARVWWILRYWGVNHVRLLNGGFAAYDAHEHRLDIGPAAGAPKPTNFKAEPRTSRLATKKQLLNSLSLGKLQIVDARSEAEHCGVEPQKNKRAGAIPGAKNVDWVNLVEKNSHKFRSATELHKLLRDSGVDLKKPTVTHCQSGGRSSVMAFALELLGADDVSNYYASWAEWGNADDTPVVQPKPSKK